MKDVIKPQISPDQKINNDQENQKYMVPVAADFHADPKYRVLQKEYQHANWEECNKLLNELLKKYPNDPELEAFKSDFEIQFSIHKNARRTARNKSRSSFLIFIRKAGIIVGISIAAILLTWGGYSLVSKNSSLREIQSNVKQIQLLVDQAEALLNSGQPEKVNDLIDKMSKIDPENPKITELAQRMETLLGLGTLYDEAASKINDGMDVEALAILQNIEKQSPGYQDVELLIRQVQTRVEIAQALLDATNAYNENRWADAILGFERVQLLDPNNSDENLKAMLLNSYLRRIIEMLESDDTTIEDIGQAEIYYRRAVAMIPQSRIFLSERENLQKISSSLLELKYTQTANTIITNPNQTQASINQAVNFLKKATNLNPSNTVVKAELDKSQMYQVGFQNYIEMNWAAAIDNLTRLINLDEGYAGGLAKQLLFEAHAGRGNSYFSVGLYLDARKEYEAAEALVWNQGNLMNLFTVEVNLGKALGKLKDYKDAASYFKYTVETVEYAKRAADSPDFVNKISEAIAYYSNGDYQESYELFVTTLENKAVLYSEAKIEVNMGTCLALIAAQNASSVQAILERNNLARQTILTIDQQLIIPSLPKQ